MRHLQTDILVIGGGSTGTGVLRDLAMRGFKCILVERRDLAYGTTGRYHGLLHSGARYVVKDPQAAKECIEENQILRHIMPQCIEDTGGYFVLTPHDDSNYIPQFVKGCHNAGIPAESIPISLMLKQEPWLNPKIQQCFHLPDGSADSFLATELNAASAQQHGAQSLTYHEVLSLIVHHDGKPGIAVVSGAICHDLMLDEDVQIDASLVVNASGAWAGKIAHMAGVNLAMVPGKGTMLALNHRVVNRVINRCKMPSDGDALVPAHTVVVMGTTDIKVTDPDHYSIEPAEIRLLLDEGEKLIPQFKSLRIIRAWAGVRPLVQGSNGEIDRNISRAFVLLDHAERDGVEGIITITSGKWTTYRKMAQVTVDKVCEKLNVDRPCLTHLEALPKRAMGNEAHHYLGARLDKIEQTESYGQLICECELATVNDVEHSIIQSNAATLDDIRRDTRLGMGPCQGAYCTFRAAGLLHSLRHPPIEETNASLRDFLQERWKGNLPILWGQHVRQWRLNELIYIDVLNATRLPGNQSSKLAAEVYNKPDADDSQDFRIAPLRKAKTENITHNHPTDILVIGAGFAGLFTAWQATMKGQKTSVITRGWGSPYWSSGCIDIIGYQPPDYTIRVGSPLAFLEQFIRTNPQHAYSLTGLSALENAVQAFLLCCKDAEYPYHGSLDANLLIPTALGTLRPSCLVPETMIAGDTSQKSPMLIVGINRFLDFFPALVADNLTAQGVLAQDISLDLTSLKHRKFVTSMVLARLFDDPEFRQEVIDALKPRLGQVGRVGFPAILGMKHTIAAKNHLESALGVPVFEIPGLPPSIPGIRLQNMLVSIIESMGGSVLNGMEIIGASSEGSVVNAIYSQAAARKISHQAKTFVLATGGILGGGFIVGKDGYAQETIFGLPLAHSERNEPRFHHTFLSDEGHPIFCTGVSVDEAFHPIDATRRVIVNNLFAAGGILGNCDPIRERSAEGIALAAGYSLAERLSRVSS